MAEKWFYRISLSVLLGLQIVTWNELSSLKIWCNETDDAIGISYDLDVDTFRKLLLLTDRVERIEQKHQPASKEPATPFTDL